MTKVLANPQMKLPTTLRIVRILDFINSEHCGSVFETKSYQMLKLNNFTVLLAYRHPMRKSLSGSQRAHHECESKDFFL